NFDRDTFVAEMVHSRTAIKALHLDERMRRMWEERQAAAIARSIDRGGRNDAYQAVGQSLALVATVAMTALGALAIIDQRLSMGALVAVGMLSGRVVGPFNQIFATWRVFTQARAGYRRLDRVFAQAGERRDSAVALARPKGQIAFDGISFRYDPRGNPVIDGLKLKIDPGAVHAIVGRNGSGKTTLLKLAQGLYAPTEGRVLIDGADIQQFSRSELASWIG
ncbi:MAG: ATP-binding cassette domain-containing protein, partial [Alphaproteobacteria bacterium]|nr:ATP-binding cassette domain-containing protein [Alphaproteobacteria bacterium]